MFIKVILRFIYIFTMVLYREKEYLETTDNSHQRTTFPPN